MRPAFLSLEFIQGRRVSYLNPIQLFMFAAAAYFLFNSLVFLQEDGSKNEIVVFHDGENNLKGDSLEIQPLDTLFFVNDGQYLDTMKNSFIGRFAEKGRQFNAMNIYFQVFRITHSIWIYCFDCTYHVYFDINIDLISFSGNSW